MVSRYGNDSAEYRNASAKMLNTFILSMRGTPFCYYGDELGMTNIGFDSIGQYKDIAAINGYKKVEAQGGDLNKYMSDLKFSSRDNGRTPMQWDQTINAGFSSAESWLPANENFNEINVSIEDTDQRSVLNHFRKMTALRKNNEVLVYGDYKLLLANDPNIYAYTRTLNDTIMLVLLNFSEQQTDVHLDELKDSVELLINNLEGLQIAVNKATLKPYQAVILQLKNN